jgi:hypothetical protein
VEETRTNAPPPAMTRAFPLGMVDRPAATILGPGVPSESGPLPLLPESPISDIVRYRTPASGSAGELAVRTMS